MVKEILIADASSNKNKMYKRILTLLTALTSEFIGLKLAVKLCLFGNMKKVLSELIFRTT